MSIEAFLKKVKDQPSAVTFSETVEFIHAHYEYQPTDFNNGELHNPAGKNEGSCKIFFFAQLHKLSDQQTLHLFGDYYRNDVLQHPNGDDHGNIRQFMLAGWDGIQFNGVALKPKTAPLPPSAIRVCFAVADDAEDDVIAAVTAELNELCADDNYAAMPEQLYSTTGVIRIFASKTQLKAQLKDTLNLLHKLAKTHKCDFVVGLVDADYNSMEEMCYFGHNEGKPDPFEITCYLTE